MVVVKITTPKKVRGNQKIKNFWIEDTNVVQVGNFKSFYYICGMLTKKQKSRTLPHYMDTYNWIMRVFDSCTTRQQASTTYNLTTNWRKMYIQEIPSDLFWTLDSNLRTKYHEVVQNIVKK